MMTTQFKLEDLESNWQQNPLEVIKGLVGAVGGMEGDLAAAHQRVATLEAQVEELQSVVQDLKLRLTALDMQARTGARHEICRGCMQIELVTLGGVFMPHSSLRTGEKCLNSGGPVYG